MKKIIGIGLVLVLFIPLAAQESKPKPDYLFWTLAAANIVVGAWDAAMSFHRYQLGEIDEGNPIIKYIYDTCPWAAPLELIATTSIVIVGSYLANKWGLKPLGYIILGGMFLGESYVIYLNFQI